MTRTGNAFRIAAPLNITTWVEDVSWVNFVETVGTEGEKYSLSVAIGTTLLVFASGMLYMRVSWEISIVSVYINVWVR